MKNTWMSLAMMIGTYLAGIVSFWLIEGRQYVTRADVQTMLDREAPYARDRELILLRLEDTQAWRNQLTNAIRENTDAITELKVTLAGLQAGERR